MSKLATISTSAQGTSSALVSIGTRHEDAFGRVFYYSKCTTAIGRGKAGVAAATITNHDNLSFQTAPAVGDQSVKVTLGGTAATAEQYKDGWLVNQDGTGEGRIYRIEGHEAQTSTTGVLEVFLADRIDIVMAISETNVDLNYNKYDELRPQDSTTQTFIPVGVPMMVGGLGASEFGYIQTWGPCAVWQDEATANLGEQLTFGAGTGTGQLEGRDAVTEPLFAVSGPAASVADEYQLVYITISR
ncbi:hypothetical protein LCGC14_1459290 [marine sediment metagenome]|uniref:Uncharacterized protein n=1 Tax=marine sediment metagenome TaxID=412755 RepID=A0A0F9K1M9_9ZZZZ